MAFSSTNFKYHKFDEERYTQYVSWYTDPDIMEYITGRPLTLSETRQRFENVLKTNFHHPQMGLYAIELKDTKRFVGIAKLTALEAGQAEVGYGFFKDYWGKGYATEVLEMLVDHSKNESDIKALVGIVDKKNTVSQRVLMKCNFTYWKEQTDGDSILQYYKLDLI